MDSDTLESRIGAYKGFLAKCDLAEENRFPTYDVELAWSNVSLKSAWTNFEPVRVVLASDASRKPSSLADETSPWLDLQWSLDLELLPVDEDGTMSVNFTVPLHKSRSSINQMAAPTAPPAVTQAVESNEETQRGSRLEALKSGISKRLRGLRSSENRRGLVETTTRYKNDPECIVLASMKWEGPSQDAFNITGIILNIGDCEITPRDPVLMHFTSSNSFAINSASAEHFYHYGQSRDLLTRTKKTWIQYLGLDHSDSVKVNLHLKIQMNERSIPRIGFPFYALGSCDENEFAKVLKDLQCASDGDDMITVISPDRNTSYRLPVSTLKSQSGYCQRYLSTEWLKNENRESSTELIFPQVEPFTTEPRIFHQVIYFFQKRSIFPGLVEECMHLMVAADVLEMPKLMEMAEISVVSNITLENVTKIIRFAWNFQAGADLLLRAALLFLKANYDEIWVNNKEELANLGAELSDPVFLKAFRMERDPKWKII